MPMPIWPASWSAWESSDRHSGPLSGPVSGIAWESWESAPPRRVFYLGFVIRRDSLGPIREHAVSARRPDEENGRNPPFHGILCHSPAYLYIVLNWHKLTKNCAYMVFRALIAWIMNRKERRQRRPTANKTVASRKIPCHNGLTKAGSARGDKTPAKAKQASYRHPFSNIDPAARASSTSPRWRAKATGNPATSGPSHGNEGGGSGSGSGPIRLFFFGRAEKTGQ